MLENEVFNRPYVRDITKTCECTCSVTCNPDIITNADRIRTMSDEELAAMLFNYKECSKNCIMSNGKHCYEVCDGESVILKWLRQPAEEGD